ncbi:hypothetical protein CAPTEDRAFT_188493 [Capitella teleta]|uniref:DUF4614 domain-containing protein n=1 Tax=Capitella teleta TaxID=283909 RepID=R7VK93_CAPTE|nr:hypothetical protein CAPTEDRAFT_188493 [Capitella teleta]|eukprot:ELU16590.1 hypothetical protein CAPTEDRAFT_188493 [Capitella teleta]
MYAPGRGAGRGGGGGGGVNALLQRASSQLKGERTMQKSQEFLSDDEEENLDAYFKTLKTKQASAVKWDAFDESDVSLGSDATPVPDVGASGSRFLKKKAPPKIEESPKPKSIALKKGTNDNNKVPKALQSAYSTMHSKQQKTSRVVLSDSDMSISLDEDVLAQIKPQSSANTVASLKAKQEEWKSERIESHDADEVEDDFFNELNLATVDDLLGRKMESDGDDLQRTSSRELKPVRSTKMKSREVQTGLDVGLHYHWTTDSVPAALDCNYRMSHVDPTPIAAHVVSSEALESELVESVSSENVANPAKR